MHKILIVISALLISGSTSHAQLVINELMQSNIDCIMDDLNDFPDSWVELYNQDTVAVNLGDYKLGKDKNESKAWKLPILTIEPKQHAVVYCDKEGKDLHTDFHLESGKGGCLYLFKNDSIIDQVTDLKKQPAANIAYGRETDGSAIWGYQEEPTPGEVNCGKIAKGIVGEPMFSEQGRIITTPSTLWLTLSLPGGSPEGAEIRYTTNGSEPTKNSNKYISPITISNSHIIRAKIFCDGYISPPSTVHSYIFFVQRPLTLPVVSIVTDDKYMNDPKIGILAEGIFQEGKKNYQFNWRRPINFEFFENGDEACQLNQLCEVRVMGNASRSHPLKSLIVYANKRFGTNRLEYEFFPDQRPGITDYKSIVLRNAGNDFDYLYMRDAIIQRNMAEHVDLDWQAWRPVIIYLNGEYKGLLNIRDRSDEDYIYTCHDRLEDIDMFENWKELKKGDWDYYSAFKTFYAEQGHTFEEYEHWMDCGEFANLIIMNLYYNNQDFPGSNIVMWRPRTSSGRWRWIAKDTDFGLGLYDYPVSYNTIKWLYDPEYDNERNWANQYEYTLLFRQLMEDHDFYNMFIDRCSVYMGDFLNEKGARKIWDPMYDRIKYEYPYHRRLYNAWWPDYDVELDKARTWHRQRTDIFYQQLADFYHLGVPTPLTVNKDISDMEGIQISMNDIKLSEGIFDGKCFGNRRIHLHATPTGDKEVTGWDITTESPEGVVSHIHSQGSSYSFIMPTGMNVAIKSEIGTSAINTIQNGRCQELQYYDLEGRRLTQPHRGINIIRMSDGKTRKIVR